MARYYCEDYQQLKFFFHTAVNQFQPYKKVNIFCPFVRQPYSTRRHRQQSPACTATSPGRLTMKQHPHPPSLCSCIWLSWPYDTSAYTPLQAVWRAVHNKFLFWIVPPRPSTVRLGQQWTFYSCHRHLRHFTRQCFRTCQVQRSLIRHPARSQCRACIISTQIAFSSLINMINIKSSTSSCC